MFSVALLNAKRTLAMGEHQGSQCPFVLQAHVCSTQRVPEPSQLLIHHWTGRELARESSVFLRAQHTQTDLTLAIVSRHCCSAQAQKELSGALANEVPVVAATMKW